MNAPSSFAISEPVEEEFDRLRLKTLVTFYALDAALEDWLQDIGLNRANASTGCRIKALAEATIPTSVASKAQASYLSSLSMELAAVIEMRNLVVHSRANFGYFDNQWTIFLSPVGFRYARRDGLVPIQLHEIEFAIKTAGLTAAKISAWRKQRDSKQSQSVSPASSPPPP